MSLRVDITTALNRHSAENGSDTPDFILAKYLLMCLEAFDKAVLERNDWYNLAFRNQAPADRRQKP